MKTLLTGISSLVLFIFIWAIFSNAFKNSEAIPNPTAVLSLIRVSHIDFLNHILGTGKLAIGGLAIATFFAAISVSACGISPKLQPFIFPGLIMIKASPAVAFAPLLVVIFGSGSMVKIIVAAMISFFPLVVGGLDGIARTPRSLLLTSKAYGARRMNQFWKLSGGYALSGYLSGLKTAAPLAVVGAIVGEFVDASTMGTPGIGLYIAKHARGDYIVHVCAGVVCATFLGIMFFGIAQLLAVVADRRLHLGK